MDFKIGDIVTRNSYQNDLIFTIVKIENGVAYLKGKAVRLCADAPITDLKRYEGSNEEEKLFLERIKQELPSNRDDYFYLPGKILHIDGDEDYLNRCLKYYEENEIWAVGSKIKEEEIPNQIYRLLETFVPNIVVITGHDAYYKKKGDIHNVSSYKNSKYFIEAVKEARKYEKSHEKLIIIAGACQSDYEELIKAGANFASSPKRINIHALDPAIIASRISLLEITKDIDLKSLLQETKYGSSGMGGIKTKGTMYVGYPR